MKQSSSLFHIYIQSLLFLIYLLTKTRNRMKMGSGFAAWNVFLCLLLFMCAYRSGAKEMADILSQSEELIGHHHDAHHHVLHHERSQKREHFSCHSQETENKVFRVSLVGNNGDRVEAIAVCHMDTSKWSRDHASFRVLGIEPGSSHVCHFFQPDNLIFVPVSSSISNI
ncbi:hypothetical protein Pint_34623 [Pistacia integerrima]|uniref:Uncharacterized protein n=1 Tax=Pistacia integerrima TaxID=434235 RepID=A0ACC0X790_9ROSI|nr:hypothetical protein Pint_34623 [Pistacia integerrima]